MNWVRQKSGVWINLPKQFSFGAELRQTRQRLSHYSTVERQVRSGLIMHYAYIKFIIFFPTVLLVFTWGATRRALNWGKWLVKKNNRAHLALRIQNILVYGAWNTSISVKLSRDGKRALFSRILWAMLKMKLRKSTKRVLWIWSDRDAWRIFGGFEILDFGYENFGKYFFWVAWFK